MRRWIKALAWGLLLCGLVVFVLLPLGIVMVMTRAGTRGMDRRLTETPATWGAPYEDVRFPSTDGLELSGWYLPARQRRVCVILCHGRFRSRREVLRQAVDLWRNGYSALLFDFRHHGESQRQASTFGWDERKDIEGAVRFLRETRKTGERVAVYGVSMGAAATLLAAAETPAVEAVIVDSVFRSFRDTVAHHARLFMRLPPWMVTGGIFFWSRALTGADLRAVDLEAAVQRMESRPILFIAGAADRRMPPAITVSLFEQSSGPHKALLIVPGAAHGHAYQTDPQQYMVALLSFLERAFQ